MRIRQTRDAWDVTNVPIANVFRGIDVDIAVYGQAVLHRISWNISLLGRIVSEIGRRTRQSVQSELAKRPLGGRVVLTRINESGRRV